jgi:hypothetical protein
MRLAIVGSRDLPLTKVNYRIALSYLEETGMPTSLISGGAKGADTLCKLIAINTGIPITEYLAEWDKYGKGAGFKRNLLIEQSADQCLALVTKPLEQSRGTAHTVSLFRKSNKPVHVIEVPDVLN